MSGRAEKYLDTSKSIVISSPAGSGKTEKLSRRYISLLDEGSDVEKILCITFTEKAAAEMKQRILSILERENPALLQRISEKIPLMRISTIHAFCLKILKRFSIELGLDPSLNVLDEQASEDLWNRAVHESLMEEKRRPGEFFLFIKGRGLNGWSATKRMLDAIHMRKPYPELILKEGGELDDGVREPFGLYAKCLARYKAIKADRHVLDFDDFEVLASEALSHGPQWHNILYSFDEHTDHILVDEFQDTNTLQWKIIDKLTEEWRSGMGPKRESGKTPTIFVVGDEKQSIYLFRGANVSVFHEAKDRFADWLGSDYHFVQVRENYRSLPAIVDFTNALFEKLMHPEPPERWITAYSPFEAARQGDGGVELLLLAACDTTKETRMKEATALASRIRRMHDGHTVFEGDTRRPCRFSDMAVLLRRRTHLSLFEDALRNEGVPFVVLKGIGFFEGPEVAVLRELISFVVDPLDSYSLFCLLRSPLFGVGYGTLAGLLRGRTPLVEKLGQSEKGKLGNISKTVERWVRLAGEIPLAELLETALLDTGGWTVYWERQRHANIRKFIAMVESYEAEGMCPLQIRDKLLRLRNAAAVPKANINAEGMDAVKIMTIHAAKGLQFPMVFIPSMDEKISPRTGPVEIEDSAGGFSISYEEDSAKRRKMEPFKLRKLKELEEEKRIFYVSVTRAMDYLCMIGSIKEKPTGRLEYIDDAFGIASNGPASPLLRVLGEEDVPAPRRPALAGPRAAGTFMDLPSYADPIEYDSGTTWRNVTDYTTEIRGKPGHDWQAMGSIMHLLFERISKGMLDTADIRAYAARLLDIKGLEREKHLALILACFERLSGSGLLGRIVLPCPDSYTELPFVLKRDSGTLSGKIDRLIIRDGTAEVYDYKTFPLREEEIPALVEQYRFQMEAYREAAEKLFRLKGRAHLVFTHLPQIIDI
jgi:ATP-dependent helicase/nuclease subunit A